MLWLFFSKWKAFQSSSSRFQFRDLNKEFKEIKSLSDTEEKERRFTQLAQAYLKKGDREKALTTILELYHNTDVKLPFLVKLAQSYYSDGNENGVLKAIEEILKDSLRKKIIENGGHQIYFEIMKENISTNMVKGFFCSFSTDLLWTKQETLR